MENIFNLGSDDRKGESCDDSSLIDFERMQDAAGYDEECLKELIDIYLDQTTEQFDRLNQAIQQNAPEDVRGIAHSAVGSSATCGMKSIVGPLRALEQMGRAGDLTNGESEFQRAVVELGRIRDVLMNYIKA